MIAKNCYSRRVYPGMFDRYLNAYSDHESNWNYTHKPAVNAEETDTEYKLQAAVPGLTKEDIKITADDGVLTIAYEAKSDEKNENYLHRGFTKSSFNRAFTLPEDANADKINANYHNGVLTVLIPKNEVVVKKAKEIKIG